MLTSASDDGYVLVVFARGVPVVARHVCAMPRNFQFSLLALLGFVTAAAWISYCVALLVQGKPAVPALSLLLMGAAGGILLHRRRVGRTVVASTLGGAAGGGVALWIGGICWGVFLGNQLPEVTLASLAKSAGHAYILGAMFGIIGFLAGSAGGAIVGFVVGVVAKSTGYTSHLQSGNSH